MARPTKDDAYRLGRRAYLNGEPFDLGKMADELGVNRVTLYRWVGTKDQLLVDVTWQLTELTLRQEWEKAEAMAGPRVPAVLGGFLRAMFSWPEVRRFNEENNAFLMRLMTTVEFGFHARLVSAVREYVERDVAEGRTTDTVPAQDLAYASVRLVESYVYQPSISGAPPAPEAAQRVLEALLRR